MPELRLLSGKNYDPNSFEPQIIEFWRDERMFNGLRKARTGSPKFYFLDGPPYPSSGEIHPGIAWNKILKDVVVRFYRSLGLQVNDVPGWDTHGLPIEVLAEKSLGFERKVEINEFGVDSFIQKCREIADSNIGGITGSFKDLGVSLNWDNPYLTYDQSYIESIWWAIKEIWKKGRIKRGLKVVHWCPRCETALADYEVNEYRNLTDPSIYVRFPLKGRTAESLLIWTTTPWTLPGNVAIMVNPDYEYARARVGNETLILGKELIDRVFKEVGVDEYEIVETFPGSSMEGLEYEHPLKDLVPVQKHLEGVHKVILSSEYVTLEEGTGCVHSAPGHGEEDYEVGYLRYKLPVISPVDDQGKFTDEAGKYAGNFVREANEAILEDLKRRGSLFWGGEIVHKYPVCWRCKAPLIMRATDQWFIVIEDLRRRLLEECERAEWIPKWAGERRFKNWLIKARDWIISRQRFWGTPIPIWKCDACNEIEVIGSREELIGKAGEQISDLHKHPLDSLTWPCRCGGTMRRVPDILDVWFDSGAAFFASLNFPQDAKALEKWMPIDFVVEGMDQIPNGWFYSLLRLGVLLFEAVPYKTVLIHGMMLDEKGHEMHKSLGNFVPVEEILGRYGRDSFRAFVISKTPWSDIRFSWKEIRDTCRKLNVIWNVYSFASLYLSGLDLDQGLAVEHRLELEPEDAWVLSRMESVLSKARDLMQKKRTHEAFQALLDFVLEDLSHLYIRLVRTKLRSKTAKERELKASLLYLVLRRTLVALAPFLPFLAEKIYLDSVRQEQDQPSVHELLWPDPIEELKDEELEGLMSCARRVLNAINVARSKAGLKKRQPLSRAIAVTGNAAVAKAIEKFSGLLRNEGNVKEVVTVREEPSGEFSVSKFQGGSVFLDISIGPTEVAKGLSAEVRRRIQQMRKEMGLRRGIERVDVWLMVDKELERAVGPYVESIAWDTEADEISFVRTSNEAPEGAFSREWGIDDRRIVIWVKTVEQG